MTKYLLKKYLKYILIILISMEIFFLMIDLLENFKDLPNSANLKLLYILYESVFLLNITLPLAIIFGWIVTISFFIKENIFISFYALGVSKKQIINPVILVSLFFITLLILLQLTPLAYADKQQNKILHNNFFTSETSNIFLKYNSNYIYFEKLYPLEKKAVNIRIFKTKNNQLIETIYAKEAHYKNNKWYAIDAKIITKPESLYWDKSKLIVTYEKFLYTLEGFKPDIIKKVYESKVQYSIPDAIYTILLFKKQNLNINKIKAELYSKSIMPYFVIPLVILVFAYSGVSGRFFSINRFISVNILVSLIVWGIFILLKRLAISNIINSELALVLPIILLFIFSFLIINKRLNRY